MPSLQRHLSLDCLCGLMLVVIAVNHYGGGLSDLLLYEPLGFVSAAEGFIFLAGLMLGMLYLRKMTQDPRATTRKLLGRAFKIYAYHLGTLLLLVAVAWLVPFYAVSWGAWLGDYAATPWRSLGAALALLYRPEYMGVLPLYAMLFVAAPLVLWCFARGHVKRVLAVSLTLYLAAPFGLADLYWGLLPGTGHIVEAGVFNPFSWQLLFVLGMYLGMRQSRNTLALPFRRGYVVSALGLALLAFVVRELHRFDLLGGADLVSLIFIRDYLSPLRLLNFFVLVYLVAALVRARPGWFEQPWLVLLGQHSLYVFSFHIVALYLLMPFIGSFNASLESVLFALLLSVPALVHRAWSGRQLPRTVPQGVSP